MFRSLRSRLGAIFLGFLQLVAASVGATALAVNTQTDDARVINLVSRQRALTQQMVRLALTQSNQPELAADLDRFERTLRALRDGGATLDGHTCYAQVVSIHAARVSGDQRHRTPFRRSQETHP